VELAICLERPPAAANAEAQRFACIASCQVIGRFACLLDCKDKKNRSPKAAVFRRPYC